MRADIKAVLVRRTGGIPLVITSTYIRAESAAGTGRSTASLGSWPSQGMS